MAATSTVNVEVFNSAAELRDRGFRLYDPPLLVSSYDPAGDGNDRDAYVMIAREEWRRGQLDDPDLAMEMILRIYIAQRMPQDIEMPEKIAQVLAYAKSANTWVRQGKAHGHVLAVETNGVGYGMAGALKVKLSSTVVPYVTVGNTSDKTSENAKVSMPRLAALDNLRLMFEMNRLKAVKGAPGLTDLMGELNAFVWKRAGRPEALNGAKDDLVMALCGATWLATKVIPPITQQRRARAGRLPVGTDGRMRIQ